MSGHTQTDLVLGTAGHIDHGKSSLVLALTGTDPDTALCGSISSSGERVDPHFSHWSP